jgi:hypothetical protein
MGDHGFLMGNNPARAGRSHRGGNVFSLFEVLAEELNVTAYYGIP